MLLAVVLVLSPGSARPAAAATGTVAAAMAMTVLGQMNQDRASRGLRPYRAWSSLTGLALDRAQRMADTQTLSHDVAGGDPGAALTARGIPWLGFGETIGMTTYPWGTSAALNIYGLWRTSPSHASIMFSASDNYVGIGFVRAANGSTWVSAVFTESPDHTPPVAGNRSLTLSGTTVSYAWSGRDPLLQTHTAGLRSFDVQLSIDGGAWRTIRNDTTATSLTLLNRAPGHTYTFRVQAADRRGTLSAWTRVARISIP